MILGSDGNLSVRGSNVLRQADEGHNNGIDADTLDGKHASSFSLDGHTHDYSKLTGIPKFTVNVGNGTALSFSFLHGLGTADLVVSVYEVATGEKVYPDIRVDSSAISLTFATAPTASQYRLVALG